MRFDAILCDLDGVLRRWPPMSDLDLAHDLPPGTLAAAAFAPDRLLPAITGTQTDDQWRASIVTQLSAEHGERAAAVVAAWSAVRAEVDPEVATLLAMLRDRTQVVLVTNATTRLEGDLTALGIADLFDHVVNSSRVGAAKPDPRIYHLAAERAGASPNRCLFIDDTAENVATAESLGMTGLHYQRVEQLKKMLQVAGSQ